jgi:hypothetical protein
MRRLVALVVAVAAGMLAGCGEGGGTLDAGPAPTRPSPTTVAPGGETTDVTLWFTQGERLTSVRRAVPRVARVGAEAVKALLAGPTEAEARAGLGTAIPAATEFRDLTITDGVARVDLSRSFESGGGTLGLTLRLAQVACTLDAFDSVTGVRFAIDGRLVDVFSGDGIIIDRPVSCDSYRDHLAAAAPFPGVWPLASQAEVDAYLAGSDRPWQDPEATARAFAQRYLGMDPRVFAFRSTGAATGEVPVGFRTGEGGVVLPDPQPTTVVELARVGGASGPWTVTGARSPDIVVDRPGPLAAVSSPLQVSGRALAFEGTVSVEVRQDGMVAGESLGRGFVTGGGGPAAPFSGELTFRAPGRPAGAVVFYERSMATGGSGVLRATVVRVLFT